MNIFVREATARRIDVAVVLPVDQRGDRPALATRFGEARYGEEDRRLLGTITDENREMFYGRRCRIEGELLRRRLVPLLTKPSAARLLASS